MQHLKPLEPGVVFWGERDNLGEIRSLGVRCGQLVTPGSMPLNRSTAEAWMADGFAIQTVFAAEKLSQRFAGCAKPSDRWAATSSPSMLSRISSPSNARVRRCHS